MLTFISFVDSTPSGVFSKRSNAGLIRHSGMICIDIDQKDNPDINDWEALKSTISDFPGLWYAGLSVSGSGLFLIVTVKYPDKHLEHFHAIAGDLLERGVLVDAGCKDVSRLRGASYDPQPLYSPSVAPYEKIRLSKPISTATSVASASLGNRDLTAYRVDKLIGMIERSGIDITDDYNKEWYPIGRALAAEFGEEGRGRYHAISSQSSKYDPKECDMQYDRCLRSCSRTSIGTFFRICKQYGITARP